VLLFLFRSVTLLRSSIRGFSQVTRCHGSRPYLCLGAALSRASYNGLLRIEGASDTLQISYFRKRTAFFNIPLVLPPTSRVNKRAVAERQVRLQGKRRYFL
jgi:hypothetical protein